MEIRLNYFSLVLAAALLLPAGAPRAQSCRVLDPELQASYAGPCVNGLAEGTGIASGIAEYHGEFTAGRKHGKGVKTWRNGDRYEGMFVADRKEGSGIYTWGRGRWAGERYEGEYLDDQRHGLGEYRWPSGDVYAGTWEKDVITGGATPMMLAQQKFREEARAAVAHEGRKVCREMPVGIAERDWLRGTVVAVTAERVGVRIDDPGQAPPHIVSSAEARRGEVVWDAPEFWTPCF